MVNYATICFQIKYDEHWELTIRFHYWTAFQYWKAFKQGKITTVEKGKLWSKDFK